MSNLNTKLILLKVDLGLMRTSDDQTVYLESLLNMAAAFISREGIALVAGNAEDDALVSMYAAWMYRKRATGGGEYQSRVAAGDSMPKMLRKNLNNKLISQKMAVTPDDI